MSIASRIEAIEQHLTDDYSVLTLAGADLTNVDKNIINLKPTWKERLLYFMNNGTDEVWENWDKVTGEGEEISLNNTLEAKMKIVLKGNTYQYSTSGKNLLNYTLASLKSDNTSGTWSGNVYSYNGITYTINDDLTIKVSGTASSDTDINLNTGLQLNVGTYKVVGTPSTGGSNTYKIQVIGFGTTQNETGQGVTFTTTQTYTNGKLTIKIYNGQQLQNILFKPMLTTDTSATYNDYVYPTQGQGMPTPDYPQDIHVVSGDNSIEICGKNLISNVNRELGTPSNTSYSNTTKRTFDISKIVKGLTANNYYSPSNVTYSISNNSISVNTTSSGYGVCLPMLLTKGTEYTLSSDVSTLVNNMLRVSFYVEDGTYISSQISSSQDKYITFTTPSNAYYTLLHFTPTSNTNVTYSNIQLEKGSTATTYEAYKGASYPINLPVENLFDKDNPNSLVAYIPASGTISYGADNYFVWVPIKKNTKYSVKFTQVALSTAPVLDNIQIGLYQTTPALNVTGTRIYTEDRTSATQDYTYQYTFDSGDNSYVGIKVANTTRTDLIPTLETLQINEGNPTNKYYPYGTTPIELCKIGDYQDYIYKDSGKWYLKKEIGKVVFDGSETWNTGLYGTNSYYYMADNVKTPTDTSPNYVYTNLFKGVAYKDRATAGNNIIYSDMSYGLYIRNTSYASLADFKTMLGTTNLIAYYVLATPTYTEITDTDLIEQLETLSNARSMNVQTNISQENDDLSSILNATALEEM